MWCSKRPTHTTPTARTASFNAGWRFRNADAPNAATPAFDDTGWRPVTLPHDWAIEGPFDKKHNARSGGLPFHGTGWYRKSFTRPAADAGQRVAVRFDAAMLDAHVWINGVFLGHRPFGYIGFEFDLTEHLRPAGETNLIAVRLQPKDLSSRWYPGAGLYRNVWLCVRPPVHLAAWGTRITTPQVTDAAATVRVRTTVVNTTDRPAQTLVRAVVRDAENGDRAASDTRVTVPAAGQTGVTLDLDLPNPRRWSPADPHRYRVVTTADCDGHTDTANEPLGVRTLETSPAGGFKLNGQPLRFNGVCLHHDHGPLGAAINTCALERQLRTMLAMGANAVRTSHNPPAPELLELCDTLGLLVQVEAFDCWQIAKVPHGYNVFFDQWHERDLRDMIRQGANHPCVVMWSIGNEILEQNESDGWKLARRLHTICKDEDPTRPTTAGFNLFDGAMANGLAAEVDLPGFNYKPLNYAGVLNDHPDWTIYGAETSSCTSSRGVYHLPIEKYDKHPDLQVTGYDLIGPPWAYPPDIEFDALEKNPRVLGEFIWTGQDYLGEPTPFGGRDNSTDGYWNDDWPARSSYFAPVDLAGFRKDRFYLYQSQWTAEPMVHLLPHWNWAGREGEPIPVFSFSNCHTVELFLNGVSQGTRRVGVDTTPIPVAFHGWAGGDFDSKYRQRWDVPYAPGQLKVVGYDANGETLTEKTVATAGPAAQVALTPERAVVTADGRDLAFIRVSVIDAAGHICPGADDLLHFAFDGPAELAAVGNGNAATTASFRVPQRHAFHGRALLVLRGQPGRAGQVVVTARGQGLAQGRTTLAFG